MRNFIMIAMVMCFAFAMTSNVMADDYHNPYGKKVVVKKYKVYTPWGTYQYKTVRNNHKGYNSYGYKQPVSKHNYSWRSNRSRNHYRRGHNSYYENYNYNSSRRRYRYCR